MRSILVTGGTGYLGSHTVLELLNQGYTITIVDDLSNSSSRVLEVINKLSNKPDKINFYNFDLKNLKLLEKVFKENTFDGVLHFAGYKAVGESVKEPLHGA